MKEDKTKEKSHFLRAETAEGRNPIKSDYIRLCADCWLSRAATFLLQYNTDRQTVLLIYNPDLCAFLRRNKRSPK